MNRNFRYNKNISTPDSKKIDEDILLLGALIYLLVKDNGDRGLIMALVYILI